MNATCVGPLVLLSLLFLSGCSTTLKVTYDSDPQGAVLYQGQQKFGYTPYTLEYNVSKEDRQRGYMILNGATVRWASGATAEVKPLRADLNTHGLSQRYNFQRPEEVPGRDIDARFALELERTRALQRQAQAQESQAAAQHRQATALEEKARVERERSLRPTNCTSTVYGSTVSTSCY